MKKNDAHLWGIILAGGNGNRLQSFTRQFYDHDRPKQYCAFIGSRSMVQHTIDRVGTRIDHNRIVTMVTEKHLPFVHEQLQKIPSENLMMQPYCRETAPAVLVPLLKIYQRDPHSIAAIFPSDHFILDEHKFMDYVQKAKKEIDNDPDIIIALGVRPDRLDHGYGWIEQGEEYTSTGELNMFRVNSFVEKPKDDEIPPSKTMECFWNTLVLVGKTEMILMHIKNCIPELFKAFSGLNKVHNFIEQQARINAIYDMIQSTNFSKSVMEKISPVLRVVDVSDVHWSDWGEEYRIIKDVRRFDLMLNIEQVMI